MDLLDDKQQSTFGSPHRGRPHKNTSNSSKPRPEVKQPRMPFLFWNNSFIWESIFEKILLCPKTQEIIQNTSGGVPKDLLNIRLICRAAHYGTRGTFAKSGIFKIRSLSIVPNSVESIRGIANQCIFAREVVKLVMYLAPETVYQGILILNRDYHRCTLMEFQNMKSTKQKTIEALRKLPCLRQCDIWVSPEQRKNPEMPPADPDSRLWKGVALESSMNFIAGLPWKELQMDKLSLHLTRRLYDLRAFRVNVSTWFPSNPKTRHTPYWRLSWIYMPR
jgi:hypothetical protein